MTIIEAIAAVLGIIGVYLTTKQKIWCWPIGIVSVSIYVYIFYGVNLYSDMILNIFYIIMQAYGWYHWLHGGDKTNDLPVTLLSNNQRFIWAGSGAIGIFLWGWAMDNYTNADLPYWDAATTIISMIAQWYMARKKLEAWILWTVVNVMNIIIYIVKDLYFTSGLFVVYLGLAVLGYIRWKKYMKAQKTEEILQ